VKKTLGSALVAQLQLLENGSELVAENPAQSRVRLFFFFWFDFAWFLHVFGHHHKNSKTYIQGA